MSISWAQGLLGAAAGVAKYSQQEKARRQAQMDRAQQMQANFKVNQAKSNHALKLKQYESSENLHKSLGAADPSSKAYQYILMQNANPKLTNEQLMNIMKRKGFKNQTAPKRIKPPQLQMPSNERGEVATSPIEDWVRSYRQQDKALVPQETKGPGSVDAWLQETPEASTAPIAPKSSAPSTPDSTKASQAGVVESPKASQADSTQATSVQQAQATQNQNNIANMNRSSVDLANDKEFMATLEPKHTPEYQIVTQDVVIRGKKGKEYTTIDKALGGKKVGSYTTVSNFSALIRVPTRKRVLPNGDVIMEEGLLDPVTSKTHYGNAVTFDPKDPAKPAELVTQLDHNRFMQKGDGDKDTAPGEFHSIFPADEMENVADKVEGFENVVGRNTDAWDNFQQGLGRKYQQLVAEDFREATISGQDMNDATTLKELQDGRKARAYIAELGIPEVQDWIRRGAISKDIFMGPEQDLNPIIQQMLRGLQGTPDRTQVRTPRATGQLAPTDSNASIPVQPGQLQNQSFSPSNGLGFSDDEFENPLLRGTQAPIAGGTFRPTQTTARNF